MLFDHGSRHQHLTNSHHANDLLTWMLQIIKVVSQEHHGVSNHRSPDCFFNSLFMSTAKKLWKLRITDPLWGEFTGNVFWYLGSYVAKQFAENKYNQADNKRKQRNPSAFVDIYRGLIHCPLKNAALILDRWFRIRSWLGAVRQHYLSQCWLRSMSPHGDIKAQCINVWFDSSVSHKYLRLNHSNIHLNTVTCICHHCRIWQLQWIHKQKV